MVTRKIRPKQALNGYRIFFRHPAHGSLISRGLGADKSFADATCYVLNLLCNDTAFCQAEITDK